jgi:hypothetical protein
MTPARDDPGPHLAPGTAACGGACLVDDTEGTRPGKARAVTGRSRPRPPAPVPALTARWRSDPSDEAT